MEKEHKPAEKINKEKKEFILSWKRKSSEWYKYNKQKFRRSLYAIYFIVMAVRFFVEPFTVDDWQVIIMTATIIIFVDIAIFNTPIVLKIGKAELQHQEELVDYLESNKQQAQAFLDRVIACSDKIQDAANIYDKIPSHIPFKERLRMFLSDYTSEFEFEVNIYVIKSSFSNIDEILDEGYQCLTHISKVHSFHYEHMAKNLFDTLNDEEKKQDIQEVILLRLLDGVPIELERKNFQQVYIVPIYTNEKNLFIVLRGPDGYLHEADGSHVANLTYVFEAFEKVD
ncbi:type II toxin-antitoxin system SpoIISA family toxin [Radiobacillus sp. PE A8.2]|uniref:type II toxin-antitoxin system SpoIISA family toxin n=1 Tax=Radiobacillus sp. PE A8.2 TaxID=3380349 RepID=UPI00388FACD6